MTEKTATDKTTVKSDKPDTEGLGRLALAFAFAVGLVGLSGAAMVGQMDEDGARAALENAHVQNIDITGKAGFWECRGATALRTSFAGDINGQKVEGAVCKNWFGETNIRFKTSAPVKP